MFRNLSSFFRTAKCCLGWRMWKCSKDLKEKILIGVANFGAYWQPVIVTGLFGGMWSFEPTFNLLISVFKAVSSLEFYCFLSWQYKHHEPSWFFGHLYPCKQDETRGTGLGQLSEEEENGEEASNSSLPPEEILKRGQRHTLFGGGGTEKGTKSKGQKLQQEKFHWGVR